MSATLKCDFKGCEKTGDHMYGFEAAYGFDKPQRVISGHFCRECYAKHVEPLVKQLEMKLPTKDVAEQLAQREQAQAMSQQHIDPRLLGRMRR